MSAWMLRAILIVMLGSVAASCGGATSSSDGPTPATGDVQQVTITARDNEFDPKSYNVEAGTPIRLTVINAGQNVHEVEVKDLLPETKLLAGQSRTIDIPAQQPGTHTLYCEIHQDAGMRGEFIIK
jgi:plastocyanin